MSDPTTIDGIEDAVVASMVQAMQIIGDGDLNSSTARYGLQLRISRALREAADTIARLRERVAELEITDSELRADRDFHLAAAKRMQDTIYDLRTELSSLKAAAWRTMETAPRDGTRVLFGGRWRPYLQLLGGSWTERIVSWGRLSDEGSNMWLGDNLRDPFTDNIDWTHWQPLPSPPGEGR